MATIFKHKVVANTVTFNDSSVLPAGAQVWGLDIMDGWKDTGDPEESIVELGSYRDGSSSASFYPIRSKYVTVGGYVLAASEAEAEALADVLARDAFPRNQSLVLTRYEAVPKFANARRSGPVELDWSAVQTGFRWTTVLVLEDPFRYSTEVLSGSAGVAATSTVGHTFPVTFPMTFGASVSGTGNGTSVNNKGTAYSSNFTATLNGVLNKGAWRLANDTTGKSIGFNVALATTDQFVLDFKNQIALLNGSPVSLDYTGTFWQLAPGSNSIRLYAEYDANASVTITGYSAWE